VSKHRSPVRWFVNELQSVLIGARNSIVASSRGTELTCWAETPQGMSRSMKRMGSSRFICGSLWGTRNGNPGNSCTCKVKVLVANCSSVVVHEDNLVVFEIEAGLSTHQGVGGGRVHFR